jgi:hypothetical protein
MSEAPNTPSSVMPGIAEMPIGPRVKPTQLSSATWMISPSPSVATAK